MLEISFSGISVFWSLHNDTRHQEITRDRKLTQK